MKIFVLAVAALAGLQPSSALAANGVQGPIDTLAAAFNKGDIATARKVHVIAPSIVDAEVPPYAWDGANAFDRWLRDLTKTEKAQGRTDGQVALGAPIAEDVHGDTAYVVRPSTYTFNEKGRKMRETGTMTLILKRTSGEWKIRAWTWTSPPAAPAD